MKKNSTRLKKLAGYYTPDRKNYKTEAGWVKGVYALNKHNFSSYQEFKQRALPDIREAANTRKIGRYNLKVPKGKLSKEDYLQEVYRLNREKINAAYSSFSSRDIPKNEYSEQAFRSFKEQYNLREQYVHGKTKRYLTNRSEIMNALQRSDFFNTTQDRQKYTLLETMKMVKTGKRRTMLSDFMRDTGYYSVDQMIKGQDIKNYYLQLEDEEETFREMESPGRGKRNRTTKYFFRGNDSSVWEVDITNSPVTITYHKINEGI